MDPVGDRERPPTAKQLKDTKAFKLTRSTAKFLVSPKDELARRAKKRADRKSEQDRLRNEACDEFITGGVWHRYATELEAIQEKMRTDMLEEARLAHENELGGVEETAAEVSVLRKEDGEVLVEAVVQYT